MSKIESTKKSGVVFFAYFFLTIKLGIHVQKEISYIIIIINNKINRKLHVAENEFHDRDSLFRNFFEMLIILL